MVKLVIDLMGGDKGSTAIVEAVKRFMKEYPDVSLVLVGKKEECKLEGKYEFIEASDIVKMDAGVLEALRQKDASMVKAIKAVEETKADGVLSCGGTGAFLSLSTLILKKIPGVIRPALTTSFPHLSNGSFITMLDVGASNENSPEELAQFAFMGSLYSKFVNDIASPKVALLSNGSEDGKGCPEGKGAFKLLKDDKKVNFIGNIEGSSILYGPADVIVSDGYSGNVMLKTTEGTAKAVGKMIKGVFLKNFITKIAYLMTKKGVKEMSKTLNPKNAGGALLVGVNAVAVKAHGNSDAEAFYNAILLTYKLAKNQIVNKIKEGLSNE